MAKPLKRITRAITTSRHRRRQLRAIDEQSRTVDLPRIEPIWPLPRRAESPTDSEIRAAFERFPEWHYAYKFSGGLEFGIRYRTNARPHPDRPLQRFRHFMPWLLQETGGTLAGKRVLDIACNSGFWSIQAALLGAKEVVGFDARPELVEHANLVKSIVGVSNVQFRQLDFWEMSSERLGGPFDVVFNFGILYHLPKPLEALELTMSLATQYVLLDTTVDPGRGTMVRLGWEEPEDIRAAASAGVVAYPTKGAIDLFLRHLRVRSFKRLPVRSRDMPEVYLIGQRASWLIHV